MNFRKLKGKIQYFVLEEKKIFCHIIVFENQDASVITIDVTDLICTQLHVKRPTDKLIRDIDDMYKDHDVEVIFDLDLFQFRLPGDFTFY